MFFEDKLSIWTIDNPFSLSLFYVGQLRYYFGNAWKYE